MVRTRTGVSRTLVPRGGRRRTCRGVEGLSGHEVGLAAMLAALQRPNLLILGQTLGRPGEPKGRCGAWQIWHAIWHGRRKTGCDRSDSAGQAHLALQRLSSPVVVLWRDRRDPLERRHPPTDQKVGGSNPSERAKSASGHGLADERLIFGAGKLGTQVETDLADSYPSQKTDSR
jgi:hypothetical protein